MARPFDGRGAPIATIKLLTEFAISFISRTSQAPRSGVYFLPILDALGNAGPRFKSVIDIMLKASTPIASARDEPEAACGAAARPNDDEAVALAEKLAARLPAAGAAMLVVSLDPSPEDWDLAVRLAGALQRKTGQPALAIETGRAVADQSAGEETAGDGGGLGGALGGRLALAEAIRAGTRGGSSVLPCGRDLGAEAFSSPAFAALLDEARRRFPWIILFSPHTPGETACVPLVARATAVVATVKAGRSKLRDLENLRGLCAELKTEFAGVVFK